MIASGQSSTITGTYAGQIVMEGFVGFRVRPWLRRLITRLLAITPAVIVINIMGANAVDALLVLSQVVLSLQLPFVLVPLLHFTDDKTKMGEFASRTWLKVLGWISALLIIGLNLKLVYDFATESLHTGGLTASLVKYVMIPCTALLLLLLLWMIFEPWLLKARLLKLTEELIPGIAIDKLEKHISTGKIGIALEAHNTDHDKQIIMGAMPLIKSMQPEVILLHVVESAASHFLGSDAHDEELSTDTSYLQKLADTFNASGLSCKIRLGAGSPVKEILRIAAEEKLDFIVMGTHGHKLLNDLLYGSTLSSVRHNIAVPVVAVPVQLKK